MSFLVFYGNLSFIYAHTFTTRGHCMSRTCTWNRVCRKMVVIMPYRVVTNSLSVFLGTGHDLAGSFLDCGELLVMQFVLLLLEVLGQIQFLLLDLFGGGRLIPCRPTEEHNTQYNIKRQSVPTESWRRECPARGCTRLSFISY